MDFIGKYVLRGAGFLIAAQVFLSFMPSGNGLLEKLAFSGGLALLPLPLLGLGAAMTNENGMRAAGFTMLFWAGAGAALFFGAGYGEAEASALPIPLPQLHQVSLTFGIVNLVLMVLLGIGVWLWGLKLEPPPVTYHDIK